MSITEFGFVAPAVPLTLNQRFHFRKEAQIVKVWRAEAAKLAKVYRVPSFGRAYITITVQHTTGHHRDALNWAATGKAIVDGLVDAGVLEDDCDCYVVGPDMRRGPKISQPGPVVTVRLEEINPDMLPENVDNTPKRG